MVIDAADAWKLLLLERERETPTEQLCPTVGPTLVLLPTRDIVLLTPNLDPGSASRAQC